MNAPPADLRVSQLTKTFSTAVDPLQILRGVDLSLDRGSAVAVTGPSGSGKSTLLYILGTLEQPTSGQVQILGEDPFSLPSNQLADYRNQSVGFIFQDHHLLPQCTVLENVLLPTLPGSGTTPEQIQHARELLDRVGLSGRIEHRPAQISGGERQRVAVCRALINRPTLLLADEPTGNLDRKTADTIGTLLLELGQESNAILLCVTHSEELAARFPRQFELQDGLLVEKEK